LYHKVVKAVPQLGRGGGAGRGDVAAATACFDLRPAGRPTTGLAALFCLLPAAGL